MKLPRVVLALALPGLAFAACKPTDSPAREGATLPAVHNEEPVSPDDAGRLAEPLLQFDAPAALSLARLSDGRWVTASAQEGHVGIYGAGGERLAVVGGIGEPPVGFRALSKVWRMAGDSILAVDRLQQEAVGSFRLVVLTPQGAYAREWKLIARDGPTPTPLCFVGDRFILAVRTEPPTRGATGRVREQITAMLFRLDGTEVARRRGFVGRELQTTQDRHLRQVLYGQSGCWACGESRIWYGDTDRYAVLELDTLLRPVRSIERAWEPVLVRYSSGEALALGLRSGVRAQDSIAGEPPIIARTYPAFDRLVDMGREGLWIGGYGLPGEHSVPWSVFGEDGRWIADTRLPVHMVPRFLFGDTLAAIMRAPDGRPVAALWRFVRRPAEKT